MPEEQLLRCADCKGVMRRVEELAHPTLGCRFLEFYQCGEGACGRKLVLQWERPDGELTDEDRGWVEQQCLARGSWFPSDGL